MPASPPAGLDRFTTFGDLLKFLRRRQGLTQRELSIAVGYSHAQISRLELNQRLPDLATIAARFVPALDLDGEPATAARLMDLAVAMQRDDAPASGAAPFKGLNYFDEPDADLFFGREALVARLVERLVSPQTAGRFLAVVGASGSGKSSIVRAGVIPALRWRRDAAAWAIHALTPTAWPRRSLAAALAPEPAAPAPGRALVVVDQFEEVFTLCRDEAERQAFIDRLLLLATEPGGATWVVITLRADFYAQCAPYTALREALAAEQEFIGPMSVEELRRAIEEPARRGGWELEAGLVDLLLKDLGADGLQAPEPGALPLLSHALLETWQRRRGRALTVSGYLASGGVRGAIAETADVVYHDGLDGGQQLIARDIFLRLTQLGDEDGAAETRRRVSLAELIPNPNSAASVRAVLTQLADARLITTEDESVEVAHEALIREWPILRGWLEADRDGLRLHRHLTLAAEAWRRAGSEPGELYRGARLAQAGEWAAQHPDALNVAEREFLAASQAAAERESEEREAQRQRELDAAKALAETQGRAAAQLRQRAVYLGVALLLALIMAGAALFFGEQARQSAVRALALGRLATARELAAAAVNNLEVDPERSILLSLQAVSTTRSVNEPVVPEAESALHQALIASRVRHSLSGIDTRVLSAVYSPDGTRAAGIGDDGKVVVWDTETGAALLVLPGLTVPGDAVGVQRIAYSPDGRFLATGDGLLVRIWDAETGAEIYSLHGHTGEVWAVAFSPDGSRIVSSGVDGSVRWWEAATGQAVLDYPAHALPVENLAVSPNGHQLATGGDDFALRLWDAETGELEWELTELEDAVYGIAYSPDGQLLAAATGVSTMVWDTAGMELLLSLDIGLGGLAFSPDGLRLAVATGSSAAIWNSQTGEVLLTLPGHVDWVNSVMFSPDGTRLLTSSMDQTVRVWDLTPGEEALSIEAVGFRLAYSPDGLTLVTDGVDGAARVWDAETGEALAVLAGHTAGLFGLAYSPDGRHVATASLDGTARVWNVETGQTVVTLVGHGDNIADPTLNAVRDIAFGPDGTRVATAGFDGTARVWETATGRELLQLAGHTGLVLGVAFNADGTRLATASTDGTTIIWDLATARPLHTLTGADGSVTDLVFSPSGARLLTGSRDAVARVWDANTGELLLTLGGHRANIWSVAYSPDGGRVATGSADGTTRVWDAETGALLSTLPGTSAEIITVAFSPRYAGTRLAVASVDGVVRVYVLEIEDLLALAHARLTRPLTLGECETFLHVQTCPTD